MDSGYRIDTRVSARCIQHPLVSTRWRTLSVLRGNVSGNHHLERYLGYPDISCTLSSQWVFSDSYRESFPSMASRIEAYTHLYASFLRSSPLVELEGRATSRSSVKVMVRLSSHDSGSEPLEGPTNIAWICNATCCFLVLESFLCQKNIETLFTSSEYYYILMLCMNKKEM